MPYRVAAWSDISHLSLQHVLTIFGRSPLTFIVPVKPTRHGACERLSTGLTAIWWKSSYGGGGSLQSIWHRIPVEPCGDPTFLSLVILLLDDFIHVYKVLEFLTILNLLLVSIAHYPPSLSASFPGLWLLGWCCALCGFNQSHHCGHWIGTMQ